MPLALGLTDAGVIVPRTADFIEEIRTRFTAATGLDLDWDSDNLNSSDLILVQLTAIMGQLLGEVTEAVQAIVDSHDPDAATGVQLTHLAAIVGVVRKKATKGEVILTLTGDPGTVITVGKLAEGGGPDGRARWVLTEDVTIGGAGTVDATFEAQEAGHIEAAAGEIDQIVTPVTGWDSVTNADEASPGRATETDAELRLRRRQSLQLGSGLGIGALRSKVLALDYVDSAAVLDNPTEDTAIVEGVTMPPSSLRLIVSPDTLTTEQEAEILRLLYDNTPGGIEVAGSDVTGTITGADGFEKDVAFDYADEVEADIEVTFTMRSGYTAADAGPALEALVEEHIEGLLVGEPLYLLQIQALAATVPGVVGAAVTINGSAADLDPTALQRVVMGEWTAA